MFTFSLYQEGWDSLYIVASWRCDHLYLTAIKFLTSWGCIFSIATSVKEVPPPSHHHLQSKSDRWISRRTLFRLKSLAAATWTLCSHVKWKLKLKKYPKLVHSKWALANLNLQIDSVFLFPKTNQRSKSNEGKPNVYETVSKFLMTVN